MENRDLKAKTNLGEMKSRKIPEGEGLVEMGRGEEIKLRDGQFEESALAGSCDFGGIQSFYSFHYPSASLLRFFNRLHPFFFNHSLSLIVPSNPKINQFLSIHSLVDFSIPSSSLSFLFSEHHIVKENNPLVTWASKKPNV